MTTTEPDWTDFQIRHLQDLHDPALPGVLDIYQQSFPVEEQMPVSSFWQVLQNPPDQEQGGSYIAVINQADQVAGFVLYEIGKPLTEVGRAGYLVYLAANPEMRGSGIGTRLYEFVCREVLDHHKCRVLFYEIEQAEDAEKRHGVKAAEYARRRKDWYRRLGGKELQGVQYLCGVQWYPPLPMNIMIHARDTLTAEEVLRLRPSVLEDEITIIGPPELV